MDEEGGRSGENRRRKEEKRWADAESGQDRARHADLDGDGDCVGDREDQRELLADRIAIELVRHGARELEVEDRRDDLVEGDDESDCKEIPGAEDQTGAQRRDGHAAPLRVPCVALRTGRASGRRRSAIRAAATIMFSTLARSSVWAASRGVVPQWLPARS